MSESGNPSKNSNDPNGVESLIWHYHKDGRTAALSIDGPFVGWHDLSNCFRGQGWMVLELTDPENAGHGYWTRQWQEEERPLDRAAKPGPESGWFGISHPSYTNPQR